MKIPEEKRIAFVGSSGSGKTTLVKLLYRFYDINKGEILIDNIDIKDIKRWSKVEGQMKKCGEFIKLLKGKA